MDASTPPGRQAPAAGHSRPARSVLHDADETLSDTQASVGAPPPPRNEATGGAPPVRLISRHLSRLLLDRTHRWAALVNGDRSAALVLQTILSAATAHLPWRDPLTDAWIGIDAAIAQGRGVSTLSISQSLDLSYASTARRVDEIAEAGLLVKDHRGVRIAPAFFENGRIDAATARDRDGLQMCMDMLAAAGHDPAPALRMGMLKRMPDTVIGRALLIYALRVLESVKQLYGDAVMGMLIVTIIAANVDHLLADPELDRQYGDQDAPPPDQLRRGITVRALARRADMPFETARRRVNELLAHDMLENRPDGLIFPARALLRTAQMTDNERIAGHFHSLLAMLSDLAASAR